MDSILHINRTVCGARVDRTEALRYIGHTGQEVSPELDARIDQAIAHCERSSKPAFAYRIFPVERAVDAASAADLAGSASPANAASPIRLKHAMLALDGADIRTHLQGAVAVGVLVCTLGLANEREMRRQQSANSLDALVYSAASSSLVECVADICEAHIAADAAATGLITNSRFSPGYGDLPLSLQPAILAALDATKQLGVSVNEANLLVPAKSTTALIGLFDHADNVHNVKLTCAGCTCAPHCSLREAGTPCFR